MSPTLRRILAIVAFALVAVGFFYVIYVVFFRTPATPATNNSVGVTNGLPQPGNGNGNFVGPVGNVNFLPNINGQDTGQQPSEIARGGPTVTNTVAASASDITVNTNANALQYYDRATGQFFQISPDGLTKTLLSDVVYKNVQAIDWAPNGEMAILSFPDGSKILYNFKEKKQTTLPRELNDFSFSPQSDQIVSKFLNPQNKQDQWLVVSKPDGSKSNTAEHLGENADKVTTSWSPNDQIVAMYQKSVAAETSEIVFLGPNGENFRSATIEGRGYIPKWSPDGRRVLYSSYSSNTSNSPHLYLMNGSPDGLGGGMIDLGLDTTADKCVFSQNGFSLYCGVPFYLNPGSGPQPQLSTGIPDNIYRVDLVSGQSSIIARPVDSNRTQRFSAVNLQLSPKEDVLFFTDATTGSLQRIQLR